MIIRRNNTEGTRHEDSDRISIDLERLGYIARKKAGLLAIVTLVGVGLASAYTIYQVSKPVENRLETDLLFTSTKLFSSTGVSMIDGVLSAFNPEIKIQENAQGSPDWCLLDRALGRLGLRRMDSKPRSRSGPPSKENLSTQFLIQDDLGRKFIGLVYFKVTKNKPTKLVIESTLEKTQMQMVTANILEDMNQQWSQQLFQLAKLQKPYAEKVRSNYLKDAGAPILDLAKLDTAIQVNTDLSVLSQYQKIKLLDQFLEKLKDWPEVAVFTFPGLQRYSQILDKRGLLALPIISGAGLLLSCLALLNFIGPFAGKIFGEEDLASAHPTASIYSTKVGSAILVNLLAASFAQARGEKGVKVAFFTPHDEPRIVECIRLAAEKSGRSFGIDGSKDSEVTLFSSGDPSDFFPRLSARGFTRILLSAKNGMALKSDHLLYQVEADLSGLVISDVVLIEQ
jgi:hypothetical protein